MENLKFIVELSHATAIRIGLARSGVLHYPLDGVLPALEASTREWFAATVTNKTGQPQNVLTLNPAIELTSAPSDEVVTAAIEARHRQALVEAKNVDEKREAAIINALALSDQGWIGRGREKFGAYPHTWEPIVEIPDELRFADGANRDARVLARVEAMRPIVAEAHAAWMRDRDAWAAQQAEIKAAKEATKAAKAQEKARIELELRAWAVTQPTLPERIRRAAKDGLMIRPELVRLLASQVRDTVNALVYSHGVEVVETYGTPEPRDGVPTDAAYAIRDALEESMQAIADSALVPGVEIKIGPFLRVISEGTAVYRSAVEVEVLHSWLGDVGCYVLTEPANQDEDED